MESMADQDLDWMYGKAQKKQITISELHEEIFLEHVGKHHNDRNVTGKSLLECREIAFEQTFYTRP